MYPDTSLLSGVRESIEDSFHFRAKMAPIPTSVRTSIWLLSAAYISGFSAVLIFNRQAIPRFPGDDDHFIYGAAMIGAALTAILCGALFLFIVQSVSRGRNWSRFVVAGVVLLEAFYALQLPGNLAGRSPTPILEVILWLMQCVAVALLFLPASNRWYRSFHIGRGVS